MQILLNELDKQIQANLLSYWLANSATVLPEVRDNMTRYHLQDCLERIKDVPDPK